MIKLWSTLGFGSNGDTSSLIETFQSEEGTSFEWPFESIARSSSANNLSSLFDESSKSSFNLPFTNVSDELSDVDSIFPLKIFSNDSLTKA